jgi:acetone carboxylase gamma subunit
MGKFITPNAPVLPPEEPRKTLSKKERLTLLATIGIAAITLFAISFTLAYKLASSKFETTISALQDQIKSDEVIMLRLAKKADDPLFVLNEQLTKMLERSITEHAALKEEPWSIERNKKMKELDIQIKETIIEKDKIISNSHSLKELIISNRVEIIDTLQKKYLYPF